jgi:hypothetical protein
MHACLHAPCMRCSYHSGHAYHSAYHSGHAYHSALYPCMHAPCMHRACMRMTSIASRTCLCDPITVVSHRDCSSSGTLAVRRVDESLCNRRGQPRSDVTDKFCSACMHACTMHALLVPLYRACVQAPRMRVHACARTILSCWRMQAYHSVLRAHARCTHVPFYPSTATVHTLQGNSPHHFWRACVHAPRMHRHTHIPFCPARA